jgi:hypothetical protein
MRNYKALIFSLLLMTALTYPLYQYYNPSYNPPDKHLRKSNGIRELAMTKKLGLPVIVDFSIENGSALAGEHFTVVATITAEQFIQNAHITWDLPDGIELASGAISLGLGDLNPNEVRSEKIKLFHKSSENKRINLVISADQNGVKIQSLASMSTLNHQKEIDEAKALQKSHEEYLGKK